MKVIAFVGESGSGKSYRAGMMARDVGADYIIDDGLLIHNDKILAGRSAKREKTWTASVRRATYMMEEDAQTMRDAVAKLDEASTLLLLGTSDRMVKRIARTLGLPEISKTVYIRDIATPEEIEKAKNDRTVHGKHVIPVPSFELKKTFSGYFMDPLYVFLKGKKGHFSGTTSIVRPSYSYLGDYRISKQLIISYCKYEAMKIKGVTPKDIRIYKDNNMICIDLNIILKYGCHLKHSARLVQQNITKALDEYAGITIGRLNVRVAGIRGL